MPELLSGVDFCGRSYSTFCGSAAVDFPDDGIGGIYQRQPKPHFGLGKDAIVSTRQSSQIRSTTKAIAPFGVGEIIRVAALGPASRRRFRSSAGSTSMPRFLI